MLRENSGHGVRITQRTNALIRPGSAAAVVTNPPYRSPVTLRKLNSDLGTSPWLRDDDEDNGIVAERWPFGICRRRH
jgi:hypothetical protein